ncbi:MULTISPECIES: DUF2213 domain-containing protein [unclassified Mesorhizobium]|uniref:DUF2213 domain-containing protein n=1 Tax=unclassified Mesorhizobium TaxID=325217 RepID=UPI00112CCB57|nr:MULTISPECIES: DUF2213 domain-containing protein [unclassified Mesorhizobium]TPK42298.1 DUF2213 domain-containing protein [Mesorhizobium sp. B2-5-2]TPL44507.1 DUF2213 domain-containing protein [Mesorhizobium sp. B2-4-5]TPM68694.1 DUF2213 domain-containing protein [Mesorhizobium sp. B2-1-6]TPN71746.1 DUF2213 domain-containing protein [Mesorhizobium sp. B1-1-2]
MQFTDAVTVAGTRQTADGYLVATARAVRTGIQLYAGHEVGKPDQKVVRVYRAADQVFSQDSLQSFSHAPITVDHPDEEVTADNWKALSVGEVSTAAKQDGQWVMLPLILKDAAAIKSVIDGKRELSAGYTCELDFTPGVTADGEAFDAQQRGIKINHLALVDRARAGSKARIGDGVGPWGAAPISTTDKETITMSDALRTVVVDGLSVTTTDQGAQAISKLLADLQSSAAKLADAETKHQTALAAKDADLAKAHAERDAAIAKVLSDADLDKRVAARADLITKAKAIAKDIKTDGLSDGAIRKAAVTAALGDAAVKDKADAYIDARFDILVEDAAKKIGGADPFRQVVQNGLQTNDAAGTVATAHQAMTDHLASAWQNKKEA